LGSGRVDIERAISKDIKALLDGQIMKQEIPSHFVQGNEDEVNKGLKLRQKQKKIKLKEIK